jgi:hypothetical protein
MISDYLEHEGRCSQLDGQWYNKGVETLVLGLIFVVLTIEAVINFSYIGALFHRIVIIAVAAPFVAFFLYIMGKSLPGIIAGLVMIGSTLHVASGLWSTTVADMRDGFLQFNLSPEYLFISESIASIGLILYGMRCFLILKNSNIQITEKTRVIGVVTFLGLLIISKTLYGLSGGIYTGGIFHFFLASVFVFSIQKHLLVYVNSYTCEQKTEQHTLSKLNRWPFATITGVCLLLLAFSVEPVFGVNAVLLTLGYALIHVVMWRYRPRYFNFLVLALGIVGFFVFFSIFEFLLNGLLWYFGWIAYPLHWLPALALLIIGFYAGLIPDDFVAFNILIVPASWIIWWIYNAFNGFQWEIYYYPCWACDPEKAENLIGVWYYLTYLPYT